MEFSAYDAEIGQYVNYNSHPIEVLCVVLISPFTWVAIGWLLWLCGFIDYTGG